MRPLATFIRRIFCFHKWECVRLYESGFATMHADFNPGIQYKKDWECKKCNAKKTNSGWILPRSFERKSAYGHADNPSWPHNEDGTKMKIEA